MWDREGYFCTPTVEPHPVSHQSELHQTAGHNVKIMVNGFRYYRALESVSIASALSTALTIYPCQIRVHQRLQSKLQLPTARKKEWRPATAGSSPYTSTCQHCDTHYFGRPRTRNLPIVGYQYFIVCSVFLIVLQCTIFGIQCTLHFSAVSPFATHCLSVTSQSTAKAVR